MEIVIEFTLHAFELISGTPKLDATMFDLQMQHPRRRRTNRTFIFLYTRPHVLHHSPPAPAATDRTMSAHAQVHDRPLMSIQQVARRLGIERRTVLERVARGQMPPPDGLVPGRAGSLTVPAWSEDIVDSLVSPDWLTAEQVAEYLGISVPDLFRRIGKRTFPDAPPDETPRRWHRDTVDRWLERVTTP